MTWQPIYTDRYPFRHDRDGSAITPSRAEWDTWKQEHPDHCRDCGTTTNTVHAGGSDNNGMFWLCEPCTKIDGCRDRLGDGTHVSHWGYPHTEAEHQDLEATRDRRRATYARAHHAEMQGALF